MGPHASSLLVLVLCLADTIHMQNRLLLKPSIRAEPGPVIPRGQPVTIVCGGPDWAELFRLVEKNRRLFIWDHRIVSQPGSQGTKARFHIDSVNEFSAGSYFCCYSTVSGWSEPSELLHLKVAGPPSSKGEEPRPQERLSPIDDIMESPADVATTVDALPEENGDMHSPSPAAGDPQEVTYAQLDQWALTRRAAHTESPQPTEPTAESSMSVQAAGVAMGPHASSLLVLGILPKPSIRAKAGPVIPRGQPVTIVCGGPTRAVTFRLEDENRFVLGDQIVMPPHDSNGTEARFHIPTVGDDTARGYHCLYRQGTFWSEPSEILELKEPLET
ncbi:LOW QUALITY PROTEIN: leukocyte-associated immunoglobulin-like receptor 1 [Phyllostomus hastatus]|uniref:LOW QUALITY PROTEIN: leukocyte-associated immunoglobulin-like receptor 1 n=1 Tax=Phyllostomus hastatus TaxID=9423 RepID=UPI001E67EB4A|nr:LOW QUALITY PROTEIN: leukocyte-associated immunoglobulin-like receptor 1 [Phyllostomus hastatus]